MKAALIAILAMAVVYFAIIRPDAKRSEAEAERRREEDRRSKETLDQKIKDEDRAEVALLKERRYQRQKKELEAKLAKAEEKALAETAPPPPAAKAPEPATGSAFLQNSDMLFTIKTDDSEGSGFICEIDGKPVAITNAHVVSGAKQLRFVKPDGKPVEVIAEQMQAAMDRDLVFFPLKTPQKGFKVFTGTSLDICDAIVCLGNSGGKSVITALEGKIVGVGGNTLEVDAEVIQGNSGCPVIKPATGEVVGVVTHAVREAPNWVAKGTRFEQVRRFCLKIEGTKWKPLGWSAFAAQAELIKNYLTHRRNLEALVADLVDKRMVNATGYSSSSLAVQTAVRTFLSAMTNPAIGQVDRAKASSSLLKEVDFEIRKGPFETMEEMRRKAGEMCWLHKEGLTQEVAGREALSQRLKAVAGTVIAVSGAGKSR